MSLVNQLHSEFEANQELCLIAKQEKTAYMDFNLQGNIARDALRRHHAMNGQGFAKYTAIAYRFLFG